MKSLLKSSQDIGSKGRSLVPTILLSLLFGFGGSVDADTRRAKSTQTQVTSASVVSKDRRDIHLSAPRGNNCLTKQSLEARLKQPIVGVPYEYHLTNGGDATGWALLRSDGVWSYRVRITWKGSDEVVLKAGTDDIRYYTGLYGLVLETPAGNLFAWFNDVPEPGASEFPVFHSAWSTGSRRYCSKLDIHDQQNTLEYFNIPPTNSTDGSLSYCLEGMAPPLSLTAPPLGESYKW